MKHVQSCWMEVIIYISFSKIVYIKPLLTGHLLVVRDEGFPIFLALTVKMFKVH